MYKNLPELFWSKITTNKAKTLFSFKARHPAKRSFASDVDTKKVGTVQSTSSDSKDKGDFRRKSNDDTDPGYIIEHKISWQSAGNITKSIANVLINYQTTQKSKVVIWAGTSYRWVLADLAILSLGAITIPVFPSASTIELRQALDLTDAKFENIIVFEEDDKYPSLAMKLNDYNLASWKNLCGTSSAEQDYSEVEKTINYNLDRADIASIIFGSGTTGSAKAVELSHGNILAAIEGFQDLVPVTKADKYLSVLPLAHIFERTACEFYALYVGAQISFPLNYKNFADELREDGITIMNLVPRMLEKLYEKIEAAINANYLLRTLSKIPVLDSLIYKLIKMQVAPGLRFFISGGAALNPQLAEHLKKYGLITLQGYGLTETSGGITVNPAQGYQFATVGKIIKGAELRIADDGEIVCSGPSVFDSYYQNEEANQKAFVVKAGKKWFKTGDLGSIDKDGFLTIAGRKKDLIVSSYGKKIQINKLETLLESIPYVNQTVLIGENRKFITALISIDQASVTELYDSQAKLEGLLYEDIKKLNQSLARYEQIKKFTLLERDLSIAKDEVTATLKLKRRVIEKNFAKEIEAMYQEGSEESKNKELLNND